MIDDATIFGSNGHDFQRAATVAGRAAGGRKGSELDVGKFRLRNRFGVVRANTQADVELVLQPQAKCGASGFKRFAGSGGCQHDVIAALLETEPRRGGTARLNLAGGGALFFAKLQTSQTVRVPRGIRIGRVRLQRLAQQQAGLAMVHASGVKKMDVRTQVHVARNFFPDEMKSVVGEPHIGAAASDDIYLARRIKLRAAAMSDYANFALIRKLSQLPGWLTVSHL